MGEDNHQPDADDSLDELSRRHVQFRMENTVLSDHLTRLITHKGSDHFHLQLEALEEDIRQTEDGSEARRTSRSSLRAPPEDGIESIGRDSRHGSLRRSSQRGSLKARPASPPELLLPLSMEEKSEIAEDECAAVKLQTARYQDESERILDDIKAVIEETELSIGEIKKENNSFRREGLKEERREGVSRRGAYMNTTVPGCKWHIGIFTLEHLTHEIELSPREAEGETFADCKTPREE